MIRNLFGFALFLFIGVSFVYAQNPSPRTPAETRSYSLVLGSDSYLGVHLEEISNANFNKYGLREARGVAVLKVENDSPAAKAGILAGDVILKFNGEEVTGGKKLRRLIGEVSPDHKARITVFRGGQEVELTAVMEKRKFESFDGSFKMPEMPEIKIAPFPNGEFPKVMTVPPVPELDLDGEGFVYSIGSSRQIGVSTSPLTKQLAAYFGVGDAKGVLVTSVRENSPAAKAGIRAGDVIVEIDGKPIESGLDLPRAIAAKKDGSLSLTIVRDKSKLTVTVTPEQIRTNIAPLREG